MAQQGRQFGQGQQLAREQLTGQVALGGPSTGPTQSLAAQELAQRGGQFAAGQQLARDHQALAPPRAWRPASWILGSVASRPI